MEWARLVSLLGMGLETMHYFGIFLVAFSGIGMFGLLFSALSERRYDLAILHMLLALGKALSHIFSCRKDCCWHPFGTALGLVLGHAMVGVMSSWLEAKKENSVLPETCGCRRE